MKPCPDRKGVGHVFDKFVRFWPFAIIGIATSLYHGGKFALYALRRIAVWASRHRAWLDEPRLTTVTRIIASQELI